MSMTPIDSPPAFPQNVTSCQRVRDATRRMRTFVTVTAQRAVFAALIWAARQSTVVFRVTSMFSNPSTAMRPRIHPRIRRRACGSDQVLLTCSLWCRYVYKGFSQESTFEILGAQVTQYNGPAIPPGNHI